MPLRVGDALVDSKLESRYHLRLTLSKWESRGIASCAMKRWLEEKLAA